MKEYEIDVKLEFFVPDDRYEPTGELREAVRGELYIEATRPNHHVMKWRDPHPSMYKYLILRERFELPDWIPDGYWVTRDRGGWVCLFSDEPTYGGTTWDSEECETMDNITMLMNAHGIELPKLPPEQSKWQKTPKERKWWISH